MANATPDIPGENPKQPVFVLQHLFRQMCEEIISGRKQKPGIIFQ